jgi:hypothetical protein
MISVDEPDLRIEAPSMREPAADDPRDLPRTIGADLEAIFGPAKRAPSAAPDHSLRLTHPSSPHLGRTRTAAIGASLAAGLAGVAVGAVLVRGLPPRGAVVSPAPVARPRAALAPPLVQTAAAPAPSPIRVASLPPARPAPAEPPIRTPVQAAAACTGEVDDHCLSAVRAADQRLRRAYAEAERAGVAVPVLVAYRRRWEDMRQEGTDRPVELLRGYSVLTRDLGQEAGQARRHAPGDSAADNLSGLLPWR